MEAVKRADLLNCTLALKASMAVIVKYVHGLQRLSSFIGRACRAIL